MGIFQQFPYSNFHEMNLDEIIKIVKNMLEEWAQYYETWDDWKEQVTQDWSDMQSFINNYFDNLNVQTEINNKIAAMVNTGEFSQIVDPYVPPAASAWLAEHITTPETVVIDDSLTIEGAAADSKATGDAINDLKSDLGISVQTFTVVSGQFIEKDGNVVSNVNFSRSVPIQVHKYDTVVFTATGYLTEVAMIATCRADLTGITVRQRSIDSTEREYSYTCEEDGYVVVSYDNRQANLLQIKSHSLNNIALNLRLENIEPSVSELITASNLENIVDDATASIDESGYFINYNGEKLANVSFSITEEIMLSKGNVITFTAKGYQDQVSVLAGVETNAYIPLIVSEDSNAHTFKYVALDDITVVISTNNDTTVTYSVIYSDISMNTAQIQSLINGYDFVAFSSVGVIGDSLASGASNYPGGAIERYEYAWGKWFKREHGIDTTLFAWGGADTRTWLTDSRGSAALQSANILDCYIIGLGVNDYGVYGNAYLGSAADVHVGAENLNADTYYGNYSRIIAAIKAKSPRAKIFCLTNPRQNNANWNTAISTLVGMYTNTYLIDLKNDDFYKSSEFINTWYQYHSTAAGYKLIAENIYKNINNVISQNINDFLDIQWIVENHA